LILPPTKTPQSVKAAGRNDMSKKTTFIDISCTYVDWIDNTMRAPKNLYFIRVFSVFWAKIDGFARPKEITKIKKPRSEINQSEASDLNSDCVS
jgi:hypothetical protein